MYPKVSFVTLFMFSIADLYLSSLYRISKQINRWNGFYQQHRVTIYMYCLVIIVKLSHFNNVPSLGHTITLLKSNIPQHWRSQNLPDNTSAAPGSIPKAFLLTCSLKKHWLRPWNPNLINEPHRASSTSKDHQTLDICSCSKQPISQCTTAQRDTRYMPHGHWERHVVGSTEHMPP